MQSLSRVLVIVVAAFAVTVLALPGATHTSSDGHRYVNPVNMVTRSVRRKADVYLTNAQRMARGLPPNRPRRYGRRASALMPRQSSTCVPQTGYIQADVDGEGTGYISSTTNSYGEYEYTTDMSQALSVSVCTDATGTFDISTLNGADFDYLGLITGYGNEGNTANIRRGNTNYAYIGGVVQEPRGAAVSADNSFTSATGIQESVESNVWSIDSGDGLSISWVNTGGNTPTLSVLYYAPDNNFIATANPSGFVETFGSGDATTLTFVAA